MKRYLCLGVAIVVMMSANLCEAERYELSKDQQQFLLEALNQVPIKGIGASQMLLQCATALQKPVIEVKEEPKEEKK